MHAIRTDAMADISLGMLVNIDIKRSFIYFPTRAKFESCGFINSLACNTVRKALADTKSAQVKLHYKIWIRFSLGYTNLDSIGQE